MVSKPTNKRKAIRKKQKTKRVVLILLLFFAIALIAVGTGYLIYGIQNNKFSFSDLFNPPDNVEKKEDSNDKKEEEQPVVNLPDKIDFQPVVDDWIAGVSGNKSVLIYDLDREEVVGDYNPDESYSTASLYKLYVVYEGYRRVQSGEWNANDMAGSTGYNILKCLDLSIRESYSPCAETLWAMIGRDNMDNIIEKDFGITNSEISELTSNPRDIMKMMKIFYEHKDITDENLIAVMKDSFLNQPSTTYNWRQGLPSGFKRSNVYNKVGWDFNPNGNYWNIYHDAAIIEPLDNDRHFIVVVMTNHVTYQKITQLGTKIEELF